MAFEWSLSALLVHHNGQVRLEGWKLEGQAHLGMSHVSHSSHFFICPRGVACFLQRFHEIPYVPLGMYAEPKSVIREYTRQI